MQSARGREASKQPVQKAGHQRRSERERREESGHHSAADHWLVSILTSWVGFNIVQIGNKSRVFKDAFSFKIRAIKLFFLLVLALSRIYRIFLFGDSFVAPISTLVKFSRAITFPVVKLAQKFFYRGWAIGILEKKASGVNDRDVTLEESPGTFDGDFHQRT